MGNIFDGLNDKKINKFLDDIKIKKRCDFYENESFLDLKNISKLNSKQTYDLLAMCPFYNFNLTKKLYAFSQKQLFFTLEYLKKLQKFREISAKNLNIEKLDKYFKICKKTL